MAIRYKDSNGNWITGQKAIETQLIDVQGNFVATNVEDALQEIKVEVDQDLAQLKGEVQGQTEVIGSLSQDMTEAKEAIEWLKVNGGGGGGGTAIPTITSTLEDCAIEKGQDLTIPIFFSSSNMGNGTAYILVNNIEVDTFGVKQGNNTLKLKAEYLIDVENFVSLYVKDRAGMVSNQLSWKIVSGGIELTSTFDYEIDYGITDDIRLTYNIETGINEEIKLYLDINGVKTEHVSQNGANFIDLKASDLGLGTHSVTMVAKVSKYVSRELRFNIVVVSTTDLYLSSTFVNNSEHTYGVPISVNYRLSKLSTEEFNVFLKIDDVVTKTQRLTVGSYYWTVAGLTEGSHKLTIQAVSLDYSENVSLDLNLTIARGEYDIVEDYKLGLICDLNAVGKSNNDDGANIWLDESGNGNNGILVNFNYGTNGFINDELVCDNDAYVRIPFSPWKENALTGSTIDLIYTPINSGDEECRVIDYTQVIDDLSTEEIKPFKGIFADITKTIPSSASSGSSAGRVNLDENLGEIHLTWVLDRTEKFMKVYVDGVLSRIMFLSDSGVGVNKFYEDFSLEEDIYLNSTKGLRCGTNNIRRFRIYDHALTSDEVLQNHIANIKDLELQEEMYKFNYENTTLPKMYLIGDTTNMTHEQSVPMKINYVSPNEEKYGMSFSTGIQNNQVLIQGTSSLQYIRKNYTIYLKDEYGADMMYNPYGEGNKADHVFCLKADYIDSSHANNVGLAKFINDCLYDTKTPSQLVDENCRTTINGFPVEVILNGESLGLYNLNYDRHSQQPFGYDNNLHPNLLVYEINSNSDTSAGAFFKFGETEASNNIAEIEYYKRDFNLIYSANRTTESDTMSEIKTLVEWVSVAEQDLFRDTIHEHFNKEYLFRYYLCCLLIGGIDSLGKNCKLNTWDGRVFYPTFYDLDSTLGSDNSGYLIIPSDCEIEAGTFNTSNSKLWSKLWEYFNVELKEEWAKMRQDRFTLDNMMKYIYDEQIAKLPAKMMNADAQTKYLNFGSLYTYCCHGSKEHHMKRWIRERIAYVDSMMDYFTSQEDQVTIRMNKSGEVSFDVTTYIPLYFSVKWSNATNGIETIKMKRGETRTFSYNSTTNTDQEILIFNAQHIKRLDNLSNLNPSSCILSNAIKLNEVEIHSTELYNINVTNNQFLRRVDLSNCPKLGTVTATGSSLDLSNCKYLKYCDVRNTALTEIQLNTSGGSLKEIYYPKTIQSIELIKQRLLETIGLPYGENGEDIPTALYNIDIEECPMINRLNMSDDDTISNTFASMIYCNNLTLRNALDLQEISFDGFHRLQNVVIENMYNLENLGFNNLLPVGQTSTLKYVALSNCPKLEEIELNCTSDDYEITLANNAVLDFGRLYSLKNITSNCVLKGLKTLVVPIGLESMFFTNEYGSGYSSVENIWVSSVCNVSLNGAVVNATHMNSEYKGIDFLGMNLKNIDLGALVNIPKAINFSLSPTHVNPNFNLNRDGQTYPYLQPEGILDLSNYTGSLAKFFNGVDLDKLTIICNNDLPQNDLSYCFYNSTFSSVENINVLLSRVSNITNLDYCFYKTTISDLSILEHINMGENSTMNYTFAECPNITELRNVVIPASVVGAEGLFFKCPITSITNMNVYVNGSIAGLFKGCNKLETINTLRIPNVTSVASTFEGCSILSTLTGFELPASCTNVDNLFNGCYSLTSLDIDFGENIVSGENCFPPNLETLYDTNISTDAVKLTGCVALKNINNLKLRVSNVDNFFDNCSSLRSINGLDIGGTLTSVSGLFKDMNLTLLQNLTFGSTITNFASCFENVSCITDEMIIRMPDHTGVAVDYSRMFAGCLGITKVIDTVYPNSGSNFTSMYEGCTGITRVENLTVNGKLVDAMFKGCSYVTKISNTTFNNATSMNELFMNCTRLEELDGVAFGEYITSANDWIKNTNLKYVNNMTLNNEIIKFTNSTTLLEVNDLAFGNNVRNISNMFANCSKLTKDIIIPSHITNCENTFKDCGEMKYIHSNWNNSYNNVITSTDCYAGCTGITHIDNSELVLDEYSTCLDKIPEEWGGYGFEESNTSVVILDIPYDGYEVSITMRVNFGDYSVSFSRPPLIAWGDNSLSVGDYVLGGVSTLSKDFSHTYAQAGKYVVKLKNGTFDYSLTVQHPSFRENIYKIVSLHDKFPIETNAFRNSPKLVEANISNAVISGAYHMYNCPNLTKVIANNVKAISIVFSFCDCSNLTEIIGLDTWDTSELTNMRCAFAGTPLTSLDDMADWNTENVVDMNSMFNSMRNLTNLDFISNWNLNKVTNMGNMFNGCTSLTSLDLSGWDTGEVTNMDVMFNGCTSLTSLDLSGWDTSSVNSIKEAFKNCSSLTSLDLSSWDVKNVTTMYGMFNGCKSLTSLNLDGWNTEGLITMAHAFRNCPLLQNLDVSHFKTENIDSFAYAFDGCKLLTDFNFLNSWDIGMATDISYMLQNTGVTGAFTLNWDLSNVVNMSNFLNGTKITDLNLRLTSNKTNIGFSGFACSSKLANWDGVDISIISKKNPDYWIYLFPYLYPNDYENSGNVNIRFYGTITRDMDVWGFLTYGEERGILDALSVNSIVNLLELLEDYTGQDTATLKLGSYTMARLSAEQIKIATDKNWTLI